MGRGAVIGAGAVVTKPIPPYSIACGNPARPLRMRGSIEEIIAHERQLYPPEKRLSQQALEEVLIQNDSARAKTGR